MSSSRSHHVLCRKCNFYYNKSAATNKQENDKKMSLNNDFLLFLSLKVCTSNVVVV